MSHLFRDLRQRLTQSWQRFDEEPPVSPTRNLSADLTLDASLQSPHSIQPGGGGEFNYQSFDTTSELPVDVFEDEDQEGMYQQDENKERGNWSGQVEFILSIVGYCVGLGNVWRFPYLAYRNGGGAFLIPYWTIAICIGLPLFMLEESLGQFSSSGPTTCWRFAPLFSGCGYASFVLITLVSLFYNAIVAWCLYYLFASFTNEVPWQFCGHEREWVTWTNEMCNLNSSFVCQNSTALTDAGITFKSFANGTCYKLNSTANSFTIAGIYNRTLAASYGIKSELPAAQYFYRSLIGEEPDTDFSNLGPCRWQNTLCLLLAWLIVFVCLINGVKSAGKVVYFTAIFPYFGLFVLLIRGLTLDGGTDGVVAYITPQFDMLLKPQVWLDAAVQMFYSLGPGWGNIIALSSYNKFNNNVVRDSLIAVFVDSGTSLLAGFTIFSYLGYFAKQQGVPIFEVAEGGPSLAFIIYPYALTFLPFAPAWSVLFFFTLLLIALDSSFNIVEGILTGVLDLYPIFRKKFRYKASLFAGICTAMFLASLPMTTRGGVYVVNFFVKWTAGWPLLTMAFCECLAIAHVYGYKRFACDISIMIPFFAGWISKVYRVMLCFVCPGIVGVIIVTDWANTENLVERDYEFPGWAFALGILLQILQVSPIIVIGVLVLYRTEGTLMEKIKHNLKPTYDWGPALVKYRKLVTYVPGFIENPKRWKSEQELPGSAAARRSEPDMQLRSRTSSFQKETNV